MNARLIFHFQKELLQFVQDPQYHKNEHFKKRCLKVAEGLQSNVAVSNLGVGAMVWINIFEPMWSVFKDPLPERKAKEIVENLHKKLTCSSNEVFDDMIRIGVYLGGQSEKTISAEVVKVRFKFNFHDK